MAELATGQSQEGRRLFWGVAKIINGTVLAQIAGFAVLPLLSRLYRPEDFSAFLVYSSVLAFVLVLVSLRYEVAIVREREEQAATDVWLLCSFMNVLMTGLAFVIVIVLIGFDALGSWPHIYQIVWLLPPAILLCGLQNSLNYRTIRRQAYNVVAMAAAVRGLGSSAAAVGLGLAGAGGAGFAAADLLGRVGGIAVMLRGDVDLRWGRRGRRLVDRMRAAAMRHKDLPLLSLPGAIVNIAGGTLTPLMMVAVFDAGTSGQFALVERGIAIPFAVLSQASSQVYMPALSKALSQGRDVAVQIFRKFVIAHLFVAFLPCAVLLLFAPQIFAPVFGATWGMAAEMTQIMAPMFMLGTAMGSVNMTLVLMGRQRHQLAWESARLVLLGGVWALILAMDLEPYVAVQLYVLAMCVSMVAFVALAYYQLLAREDDGPAPALPQKANVEE